MPTIILKRDGKEVCRGDQFAVTKYIHNNHSCSMSWALLYEGYTVEQL